VRRRDFITLLGAAMAWPLTARAQQPAMPVIGFLAGGLASASEAAVAGFRQGLRQTGYVEGQNLHIAFRWAEGHYERLPQLAAELVSLNVSAITAIGAPAALPAIAATKTIPIAFISSVDPVKVGLVASFNRPGGNATGVAFLESELVGKQFELLRELLPKAAVVALLVNPKSVNAETQLATVTVAKQALGLEIVVQNASTERDLEAAFAAFAQRRVAALVVGSDPFFYGERALIVALTAQHALPTVYYDREYVAAGGLMSYGASLTDAYRQAGVFTGRFLKGDKPADLPVQQAVKVELIVNLKTAKALGIEMPLSLLMRINEAIE
jgi:putative tryptophan/tyrosine transport system substrate-binding protein